MCQILVIYRKNIFDNLSKHNIALVMDLLRHYNSISFNKCCTDSNSGIKRLYSVPL